MKITVFSTGMIHSNCYIAETETSAVVVDCGGLPQPLCDYVDEIKPRIKAVLLTHGHCDHISGAPKLAKELGVPLVIHRDDSAALFDEKHGLFSHLGRFYPFTKYDGEPILVSGGETLRFGDITAEVIHTPGHSEGSVCYKIGDKLFSGDTLFNLSVGRTDFEGSDPEKMSESLKTLMKLPDNTEVFPGHGEKTTIGYERQNNPYISFA